MLNNDFYTIANLTRQGNTVNADLQLNEHHAIFAGHFPGQPVVPGACMLQMLKELLAVSAGKAVQLSKAADMKFLAPVDPAKNNLLNAALTYTITNNTVQVTAIYTNNTTVCFKFKGVFKLML
jgi:3-hydroxyacyl-[acyl-carrier-protein] dehydratase